MRICLLEGDMSRSGGTERMAAWLAGVLSERWDVSLISLRQQGELFFSLKEGVRYAVVPEQTGRLGILRQIRWIRQYLRQEKADWVINVDVGMGFYGILAALGTGTSVITWEHGNFCNNWNSRLFPLLRRIAARFSDALVVLTHRDQENYSRNIPRCAPIHVIPNPVDSCEPAWRPENRVILSAGHLLPNKGFHRAVQVAARVLKDRPGWRWVICGEGPERERLETMIREAGLEDRILLPGLVKDMEEAYSAAAMVVLTSDLEGLPMVLLEGKARCLPLVAFDIMTGPSEIIREGTDGFLVEPFDLEGMARRIGSLMDDENLRREMSAAAGEDRNRFSSEEIGKNWEKLLKINRKRTGNPRNL